MFPLLNVRARGSALVPVHEAGSTQPRRFVGRAFDASLGQAGGWPFSAEPVTVPLFPPSHEHYLEAWHFYYRALKDKELWPADEATAKACGIEFDPSFGGEYSTPISTFTPSVKSSSKPEKEG